MDATSAKLAEIRNAQADVDRCAQAVEDLKEELKAARENWEAAVENPGNIIRDQKPLLEAQ